MGDVPLSWLFLVCLLPRRWYDDISSVCSLMNLMSMLTDNEIFSFNVIFVHCSSYVFIPYTDLQMCWFLNKLCGFGIESEIKFLDPTLLPDQTKIQPLKFLQGIHISLVLHFSSHKLLVCFIKDYTINIEWKSFFLTSNTLDYLIFKMLTCKWFSVHLFCLLSMVSLALPWWQKIKWSGGFSNFVCLGFLFLWPEDSSKHTHHCKSLNPWGPWNERSTAL